jgi:D-lactate dehydrogenase
MHTLPLPLLAPAPIPFCGCNCVLQTVQKLCECGVKLIAMRCAGYDRVDLTACADFGIKVVRVPTYSPNSVAEHAVALMFALNK